MPRFEPQDRRACLQPPVRLALGLAVALASWAVANTCFIVVPQSRDDVVVEMLARGVGIAREQTAHLVFVDALLGRLLTWLYAEFPGVSWYRIVLSTLQIGAAAAVGYVAMGRPSPARLLLWAGYVLVFDFHAHVHPHFATAAAAGAQAAIILWAERAAEGLGMAPARWGAFLGLAAASVLVRTEALALIALAAAPAILDLAGRRAAAVRAHLPNRALAFAPALVPFAVVAALACAAGAYDDAAYAPGRTWVDSYRPDDVRRDVFEVGRVPEHTMMGAAAGAAGWSANDELMLRLWVGSDRRRTGPPSASAMWEMAPPGDLALVLFRGREMLWQAQNHPPSRMMTAAALLPLVFISRRDARVALLALAGAGLTGLVVLSLSRNPPPVSAPLLGLAAALPLALALRKPMWDARRPASWLEVGWPVLTAALAAESVAQLRFESRLAADMHRRFADAVAALRPRPGQLYVVWAASFPFELVLGQADFESLRGWKLLAEGYPWQTRLRDARLAEFGINDLYRALVERRDLFVISSPALNEAFSRYMREHHRRRVVARPVLRSRLSERGAYDFATRMYRPAPLELDVFQFREAPAEPPESRPRG